MHRVTRPPAGLRYCSPGAPASASGGTDQFVREVVPGVAGAISGVARTSANGESGLLTTLRGEQERRSGANERADHEAGPEEPNSPPVDRATVGLSARTFDRRVFFFGLGEAATKRAHTIRDAGRCGRWRRFGSAGRLAGSSWIGE